MPTVQSCNEDFGSRDWEITLNSKGVPVTRHTRTFKVVLSDGGQGADAISAGAGGLPGLRDSHPYAPLARCKSLRGRSNANDDKVWMVDAEYDTETASEDEKEQEQPDNPLDERPDVQWTSEQFTKVLHKDVEDKPVRNSADEQFDPLPEVDDTRNVLQFTRNEASNPISLAADYANVVNSDTFLGWDAGKVLAKPLEAAQADKRLKDGTLLIYWRVTYRFHMLARDTDEAWDELKILDQGYREKSDAITDATAVGDPAPYVGITDEHDLPISRPALLDGAGSKLFSSDEPKFLTFKAFRRKSFSAFNINPSQVL